MDTYRIGDIGIRRVEEWQGEFLPPDQMFTGFSRALFDQRWVPTFPRARYLFSAVDRAVWDPAIAQPHPSAIGAAVNQQVFEDSVAPLLEAGRAELIDDDMEILPGIRLVPTPGHTPGHLMMHITSAGEHALSVGDILHHPIQARETRREVLHQAAALNALVFPAHFGGQHCFRVSRVGNTLTPALYPL